ncbi:hypothetical protein HHK36_030871 [Tetracentron sinense]|uniref:AB hydrolase-1 domain-containing protein n=1 Tax=Tetracentron sinense TaxID=13715 RepID=A0A834YCX7_TETSI|nr:hypothetical protein HHK36_030871 [Tetracentron sinense]
MDPKMSREEMAEGKMNKHFILVHGACHGAWSWYKLKLLLESAGHRVTSLDLAASGINMKKLHEVLTISDYSQPLMETMASLPPKERVILVGHSLGGLNLAVAMDKFPEKIYAAVFVTAFMPDTAHRPSYVMDKYVEITPADAWLDTQFSQYGRPEKPATSMVFGPKFVSSKLYQLSSLQDATLGMMLIRPGSLFLEDLAEAEMFSKEGYGSVARVFVVCKEDAAITEEFQRWMIENDEGVKEVKEIEGADHMPMLSKPEELCRCLLDIGHSYS